ncbi:hypothetical protein ACFQE1_18015, partial [Halobium palmae]
MDPDAYRCEDCRWEAIAGDEDAHELLRLALDHFERTGHRISRVDGSDGAPDRVPRPADADDPGDRPA